MLKFIWSISIQNGRLPNIYKMKIEIFPRIHLTLIDFSLNGYRKFGGIGFSLNTPSSIIEIIQNESFSFDFKIKGEKVEHLYDNVETVINLAYQKFNLLHKASFSINLEYPLHSGLGTGTNLTLACLEGLFIINNKKIEREQIIQLSSRGRTSGIGIQTYFDGGFVFDGGVKNTDNIFLPSNSNKSNLIAKPIVKCVLPNWPVLICIPKFLNTISVENERSFFENNTPLMNHEVQEILYHSVFGITSSILENDFEAFCVSLKSIQKTKWKLLERSNYSSDLIKLEKKLYDLGADTIAMSSLGPTIVAFSKNYDDFHEKVIVNMKDEISIYNANLNNEGRKIYA
jgi:beta-ribofuranosylaminobenzene 5'-phosphate synthase